MKTLALAGALSLLAPRAFAAFDESGFSARAIGLGNAMTAVYDDANATAYNPANLGQIKNLNLLTSYLRQFHIPAGETDREEINAALAVPIRQELLRAGLGFGYAYTTQTDYAIDRTIQASYGSRGFQEFENGSLDFGATVKFLTRNFATGGGATKGSMDIGLLYRYKERYAAAISLLNMNGPSYKSDRVPVTLKIGVSEMIGPSTIAVDLTKRESSIFHSGSTSLGLGAENWWATPKYGSFAGRTGLSLGDQHKSWNWGLGWRYQGGQIDYSMSVALAGRSEASHAVSMTIRFGVADPEQAYERLLKSELGLRKDLSQALEAAEVRQWQLSQELGSLRQQIDALRGALSSKTASERSVREKLQELEERHRKATESFQKASLEQKRLSERSKETMFREDWASYEKLKLTGASNTALLDRVKRLLREYKDSGVDLSAANQELQRLLRAQ
jgi:hypothetical protein